MISRVLSTVVLLLSLSGCQFGAIPGPEPWEQVIESDDLLTRASEAEPLPYRVAIAPPRIRFDPNVRFAEKPSKHAFAPDTDEFRTAIVEGLLAVGLFERVEGRGEPSDTRSQVLEQAWASQDDLLLEIDVRSYHQELLGHTGTLLWFVLYSTYVFPAWYVPIDRYGGGLEVQVRLGSVQEGTAPLLDQTYYVRPEEVSQVFTPDQRELAGFLDLGALWNVETSLEESNWRAIERGVGPHTQRRFLLKLLRDLEATVASDLRSGSEVVRERLLSKIRKRFALVAGVSAYGDPAIGSSPFAARDAEALAATLASPPGGALAEGRELLVLTDGQATRASILDGIASIASRATPSDEVVVYLSGYGATLDGHAAFLPQDARAEALDATSLSLAELGAALEEIAAERVVVLVDASFGARGPRSVSGRGASPDRESLSSDLRLGQGRAALFAAQPAGVAYDLSGAEAGLFSHVVRTGLEGIADRDGDGRVDLRELYGYTRDEVRSRAGLEGFAQEPLGLGLETDSLAWPR